MTYMAHSLATLARFESSSKFATPPGMVPEDYDDEDFDDEDGVDPGYDGILGEG